MIIDFSILPFAQEATETAAPTGGNPYMLWIMLLGLFGFMLLTMGRQSKAQKKHAQMIESLKTGDEVLTDGGLFGRITNVKQDRFVIRSADDSKFEIAKYAIKSKLSQDEEASEKK